MPETLGIIIGLAGVCINLAAYGLLTTGRISAGHARYQWMNVMGTLAILASLAAQWNLASCVLNLAWLAIGLAALMRRHRQGDECR